MGYGLSLEMPNLAGKIKFLTKMFLSMAQKSCFCYIYKETYLFYFKIYVCSGSLGGLLIFFQKNEVVNFAMFGGQHCNKSKVAQGLGARLCETAEVSKGVGAKPYGKP